MIELIEHTLVNLGVDISQENKRLLVKLISTAVPERRSLIQMRMDRDASSRRRKAAEDKVDNLRDSIEKILNDCGTKNEILTGLESLLKGTSYED